MATHTYRTQLSWRGSTGAGYRDYSRDHTAVAPPAAAVALSADPAFRGDPELMNPEQLLVMAASSCQLLAFLALAARAGVDVIWYEDDATAVMTERGEPTRIERIDLAPIIRVATGTDHGDVRALVEQAHRECYIANSLNSVVTISATLLEG